MSAKAATIVRNEQPVQLFMIVEVVTHGDGRTTTYFQPAIRSGNGLVEHIGRHQSTERAALIALAFNMTRGTDD